jgi:ParB-like chromosome segregation protein Spo0J
MMVVGFKSVPIAKLRLPGDWKKTLDDPSIPARALSQKVIGIIHEPWVRERDWKLLIGRRRIAAALHNGEEEVLCKLVECTDEEGDLAADIENAYREHMTPAQAAALVSSLAEKIALLRHERGKDTVLEPGRKKGRMKLPRTVAREIIAQATGRSKETQRKAEQREVKKNKAIAQAHDHDADIGISSPWADLDDDFRRQTNKVVGKVHELAQLLSRAVGGITQLVESGLPVHQARLNRLKEDVALCGKTMRGLLPSDLCPFCKGIPALQEKCGGCLGTGYITTNQREGVPKELWEVGENALVMSNGKREPYESFFAEPETDLTMTTEDPFAGIGE